MKLLIIRHAIAMDRGEFHKISSDDSERPLTAEGIKKMRKNALGLKAVVPKIDFLFSSPLMRAEQTARLVSEAYSEIAAEKCDPMKPEADPADLFKWLKTRFKGELTKMQDSVVAVVGHEPHLSELLGYCLTGRHESLSEMRKGGACLIAFDNELTGGKGQLEWLLRPSVMRVLAKSQNK